MVSKVSKVILIGLLFCLSMSAFAQDNLTPTQRLDLMRQKLETMRRSLSSAANALKDGSKDDKTKKDDKAKLDTPFGRLVGLEKEAASVQSEANSLKGKIDRAEKYEISDVDQLEERVKELQARSDAALVETAALRSTTQSTVGQTREVKRKTKKLLWLIPIGKERDEYEELIGSVQPGRDRELFIVATREIRKSNFEVGRLLFQTIITTYPDSPYLAMSKLAVADSFYLEGTTSALVQAAAGYQDWLTFFPTHPLADRVLLKIAESEMRRIGLPDREIPNARRAEQKLKAFIQNYPNSPLRPLVELRLAEVQDNLGLHNLYIANYYYKMSVDQKKGGLKGAQSRYREILDKYPSFSFMDEALFKIAVTYLVEEETDQAARYFQRLVSDFPNSEFVDKAKEQLNLIGATIPEANPNRKDVLPPEKVSFFANFRNQLFGVYPLTIDKDGVLMTRDFDKCKFEVIDRVIENLGQIASSEVPKTLTAVVVPCETQAKSEDKKPAETPKQK
ncbi:MAG: outer membrane protein assembly factor BamD [Acidobacteria bacterium]|nr:outer membrane protein assembly factor BamD [Acidobacteriota bacterium]MBK8150310.1 outer membrane protein assembly factor BamD [Acidobacteriota bacterium]MBK8811313.1 outer membrane protein assembly factor BamD [Acidobacteriota bacterium]